MLAPGDRETEMPRSAQAATIGLGALMVFQAALAVGAPLGEAAWGGGNAHLSSGQRVASAVAVVVFLGAIVVLRRCAAGRTERRYRWGTWALAGVMTASGLLNAASASPWERYLLAPLALGLAALCVVVARSDGAAGAAGRDVAGPSRPPASPSA
jgi:hypothetical protein